MNIPVKEIASQLFYGLLFQLITIFVTYITRRRRRLAIGLFLLGSIFAGIIAFTPIVAPTNPEPPSYFKRIAIQTNINTGTKFQAGSAGLYTFRYAASAYSTLPNPLDSDNDWFTSVLAFRGQNVLWNGDDLDYDNALFFFDGGKHVSRQKAIEAVTGKEISVTLNSSEEIVIVATDGKTGYDDNQGEVYFDVFYTP